MVKKIGQWNKTRSLLSTPLATFDRAIDAAVSQEAENFRKEVIRGLDSQAPGGKRLKKPSALTLAGRKGRGTKALIDRGDLRRSVKKVQGPGAPGKRGYFVGVLRQARSRTGDSLVNIAATHEFGASFSVKVTPAMRAAVMATMREAGLTPSGSGKGATVYAIRIPKRPFLTPVANKLRRGAGRRMKRRIQVNLGLLGKVMG